jgi:hypothetical protein
MESKQDSWNGPDFSIVIGIDFVDTFEIDISLSTLNWDAIEAPIRKKKKAYLEDGFALLSDMYIHHKFLPIIDSIRC